MSRVRNRGTIRVLIGVSAVLGLAMASLGAFAPEAKASEFNPVPTVKYLAQCFNLHQGLHVSFVLANEGQGGATFHLVETVDGVATTADFDVFDTPATPDYFITQGKVPSFDVTSTDGSGVTFHQSFGAVDCEPEPAATIDVVCPAEPGGQAHLEYHYANPSVYGATFTFTDPSGSDLVKANITKQPDPETVTRPVAEGTHVQATVLADGVEIASLDTVIDCLPPVTTTTTTTSTTTTTTSTTTTTPSTTTTTLPGATTSTTVPPTSSTLPLVVSSNTDTQVPVRNGAPAVANTSLARTGSNSTVLAIIGSGLLALGLAAVGASRRLRRTIS